MSTSYVIEYAKTARSSCKNVKCKGKLDAGELRIGKVSPSPFGDGDMTNWYHAGCIFDAQSRQRADTKKIASASDLGGFADIKDEDKKKVEEFIAGKNLPVFKNKPKKKKKADSEDDDGGSDSDDQPKKKAKAAPKKKAAAKKKKADSDDDGGDSDSAEVVPKSTKRGPPKSRA